MAALPQPLKSLSDRIYRIEEALRQIQNASPFSGTGLSIPEDGTTQVDGNLLVLGDFTAEGKVNNEALVNPVIPQSVWKGTTSNFGLTVPWSALVSQTLTVPEGVTSVQVIGFVRLVATNTTAVKDYLYSDFDIGGQSSGGFATPVDPGDPGTSFCSFARTMSDLEPGQTITLTASGSTGFASWASTNNVCQISASVTWYR